MDKLLRVKNLSKGKILNQISFEMEQGEMLAVIQANRGKGGKSKVELKQRAR